MKRLLASIVFAVSGLVGSDSNRTEAIFRKVCNIERKECDVLPKVTNIQNNVVDLIGLVGDQSSDFDELSEQLNSISEFLSGKLESLSRVEVIATCTFENIIAELSGIDDILVAVSEQGDLLCSKIDDVGNTARSIDSKVDGLDESLGSIGDTLCIKSILTQSAIEVLASSQGLVSTFGESITSGLIDEINIQFQYGIPDFFVVTSVVTTGTVVSQGNFALVGSGTDSGGSAYIQSKRALRYRTGHEAYAIFTAVFTNPGVADSTQLIGLFDDDDGTAVGFNGTEFSILFRRDGDADVFIPQSDFNRDSIDGTGASGFNLNPGALNIFRISYGWLGAAPIKFQVMNERGAWITFHVIEQPNSSAGTSFNNPVLPIRAEVKNNGNTSDIQLITPSWNAGLVGGLVTPASRFFTKAATATVASTGTEKHVMTLRNRSIFHGISNKIEIRISGMGGGGTDFSNTITLLRLRKNATVTGTSYSDFNSNNSVIEISTAGTFVADTGFENFSLASNTFGSGPSVQFFPKTDFNVSVFPGETITLTAEILQSTNVPVIGSICWEELF